MTITASTADQLDALAAAISALQTDDPATDSQFYSLIAPVMLAIDVRTMTQGFRYTLNITNALQGRPKHWYLIADEMEPGSPYFATANFEFIVGGFLKGFVTGTGASLGLATCAGICRAWAQIIRLQLAGDYTP